MCGLDVITLSVWLSVWLMRMEELCNSCCTCRVYILCYYCVGVVRCLGDGSRHIIHFSSVANFQSLCNHWLECHWRSPFFCWSKNKTKATLAFCTAINAYNRLLIFTIFAESHTAPLHRACNQRSQCQLAATSNLSNSWMSIILQPVLEYRCLRPFVNRKIICL